MARRVVLRQGSPVKDVGSSQDSRGDVAIAPFWAHEKAWVRKPLLVLVPHTKICIEKLSCEPD